MLRSPSFRPPMMIGTAYEASPRVSTSATTVGEGVHASSAYSSSTTLVAQLTSQHPSPQTSEECGSRAQDSKASLEKDVCSSPPPTHPRDLPLYHRIKQTSKSSRAKKTHVVSLDTTTIEAFGGYGTLVGPDYWRQVERDRGYAVVGRFLRTLGLRSRSAPQRESTFEDGTRVANA